jgi:predicted nucleic acid-binding protein
VLAGRIDPVISPELADELLDVLARPKLQRYLVDQADLLSILAIVSPFVTEVTGIPAIRDPDDRIASRPRFRTELTRS